MKTAAIHDIAQVLHESLRNAGEVERAKIGAALARNLAKKGQLGESDKILDELQRMMDREEGIIEAFATVREKISESTLKNLKEMLKEKYKAKEIRVIEKIDKAVLGGIRIQVGEEVYDATLKNSLHKLQKQLKA